MNIYSHPNQRLSKQFAGFNEFHEFQKPEEAWKNAYAGAPVLFRVDAFDGYGNRRFGLDTLVVQFKCFGCEDTPKLMVFYTNATSHGKMISLSSDQNAASIQQSKEKWQKDDMVIAWPKGQTHFPGSDDYQYQFPVRFPRRGVWQASAWICPVGTVDFAECMSESPKIQTSATVDRPDDWADDHPIFEDVQQLSKDPLNLVICQQNAEHELLNASLWRNPKTDPVTDRVAKNVLNDTCLCKPGWFHWSTDSEELNGNECRPCGIGTFQDQFGQESCLACPAGRYAACTTTADPTIDYIKGELPVTNFKRLKYEPDPTRPDDPDQSYDLTDENCPHLSPAATQCKPCRGKPAGTYKTGTYAWDMGKERCDDCQKGFDCKWDGMVYPVAGPGYWISPTNPQTVQTCNPPDACQARKDPEQSKKWTPTSTWAANTRGFDHNDDSDDRKHPTDLQCFRNPWHRLPHDRTAQLCDVVDSSSSYTPPNTSATGDPLALGHDKISHELPTHKCDTPIDLQSTADVVDCWVVIGATCTPGYMGDGCTTCCKNCQPTPQGEACWKGDKTIGGGPLESTNSPECLKNPE
eukprot:COSAG06_NODE_8835_length_2058_cov_1.270036_1_plen_578_part_10